MFNLPVLKYSNNMVLRHNEGRSPISDKDAKLALVVFQRFSDQVMQFMAERGSSLRLFAMRPPLPPYRRPAKDVEGQQWPNYAFTKGSVTDVRGIRSVVAVPLALSEKETAKESFIL